MTSENLHRSFYRADFRALALFFMPSSVIREEVEHDFFYRNYTRGRALCGEVI